MNKIVTESCPICSDKNYKRILNLDAGKLDNSTIYQNIILNECDTCGHIFNELSEKDIKGLINYYKTEYTLTNIHAPENESDRPGSKSKNSINRYKQLYEISKKYLNKQSKVLDIGCGMGGFLNYLEINNLEHLSGIDFSEDFVKSSKNNSNLNIKLGNAEKIPFNNNTFDIVFMDQVLEHLVKPKDAFNEVKRVLKHNGYFCIGVPNAINYNKNYIFDFFWFLMKEHIQHFDINHLEKVANLSGFELLEYKESNTPIMRDDLFLPNLTSIFKLTDNNIKSPNSSLLAETTIKYLEIEFQRLKEKKKLIKEIEKSQKEVYIWGIGREFTLLFENTLLNKCNIKAFIDGNEYKRNNLKIKDKSLSSAEVLKESSKDSILIITASAYFNKIKDLSIEIGFKGKIIEL